MSHLNPFQRFHVSFYRPYGITSRIQESNYTVFWSNDNITYALVKDWTFHSTIVNGQLVHSFEFEDLRARYVKIHENIADTSMYTFVLNNPQINVKAFCQNILSSSISAKVGIAENDISPTTGILINWVNENPTATDYNSRSIGLDLESIHGIGRIELWDSDATARLEKSNYTVFWSNDNITYIPTKNWTFHSTTVSGQLVHSFDFSNLRTQYVKIHQNIADTSNYTFVLKNPQIDVRAYDQKVLLPRIPVDVGIAENDIMPTTGILINWVNENPTATDYNSRSIGFDMESVREIGRVELWDTDATSRVGKENYTLFWSNDNVTYVPINNWTFHSAIMNDQLVHSFDFSTLRARYIKIHQNIVDTSMYSFVLNNPQVSAIIFKPVSRSIYNDQNQLTTMYYYHNEILYETDYDYDSNRNLIDRVTKKID